MATLHLTGATTVAELREQFNAAFGSQVKIYNGGRLAEPAAKLSELGLKADADFSCYANLTVGSFIERMKEDHGLKVKVYTCDEWVAVLDGLTLEASGKVKKNATKADMESLIAYQRTDKQEEKEEELDNEEVEEVEDEEFDEDDEEWEECVDIDYKGINYSATDSDGKAEACMIIDEDDLEDADSFIIPQTVTDPETGKKYTVNGYTISEGAYTKITFPATLEYIQGETFSEMDPSVLAKLQHNLAANKNFIIKGRHIYQYEDYGEDKHVYQLRNVQLARPKGTFVIPDGVEALARSLFQNCDELKEVIIPASVRHIDIEDLFKGCDALERVVVYAPKGQIKCYDDLGEEGGKLEDVLPDGTQLIYATEPTKPVEEQKKPVEKQPKPQPKTVDMTKVENFLRFYSSMFPSEQIPAIKDALSRLNDSQFIRISNLDYKKPMTTFLLAFILGFYGADRFYLGDFGLGVLKLFTCGGFFIWWLIDLMTAVNRTKRHNAELILKNTLKN